MARAAAVGTSPANAILFVTQVPQTADFATIGSVFANHLPSLQSAPRGGDLWIRYASGSLCNLTEAAGYGDTGQQGANAIAVRDPEVHWNGSKAIFSMVIGAPTAQYQVNEYSWQLYEVEGWDDCTEQPPTITKVPNQPVGVNNVQPTYASDGRIVFVSDRSRSGEAHLYPQLDEYESTPTPTGLWSLDPLSGELFLMNHAPSGSFDPTIDSFGRVIFTRWDHLQRDQQSDGDPDGSVYGTFDYASEAADAARSGTRVEVFPEPRGCCVPEDEPWTGHRLNSFFPWQINQDGSGEEFLNHVGRHELQRYFNRARDDDPALREFIAAASSRTNPNSIENFLQIREDPASAGRYLGTDAPEFQTHASGQIISMVAAPDDNPDGLTIEYVTHPDTGTVVAAASAPASHTGHYRDPTPLADGGVLVVHTPTTGANGSSNPQYEFRLRLLEDGTGDSAGYQVAGAALTGAGISESVTWWDPDNSRTYNGLLWELNPVEVLVRTPPAASVEPLPAPETARFNQVGVDPERLRQWMAERELGLISVRDVTTRDDADLQQPFNLRVPGGRETVTGTGAVYEIDRMQLFQGDQVRGYGGVDDPRPGRRILARHLHEASALAANELAPSPDAVEIASDGSVAAFLPARRALAWQTLSPSGEPVVRERFWITLQPGEIRACDGCHGVNELNQLQSAGASQQEPLALRDLLQAWKELLSDGFESGSTAGWSASTP